TKETPSNGKRKFGTGIPAAEGTPKAGKPYFSDQGKVHRPSHSLSSIVIIGEKNDSPREKP
ncbi:MAG: hypothetical protein IKE64_03575, partial [Thermoguttaceae bacterium]|nr:hypothetical protein [Thermoguttaceae bacterium]